MVIVKRAISGPVRFVRDPDVSSHAILLMVLTDITLSAGEELGFRGYPFRRLWQAFGTWPAQIVVALALAAYHVDPPRQ